MPKRIVDGEGLWRSSRLSKVNPSKYRAEAANLLPLSLANGVFEAEPALVWAQVYAYNRPDVTCEDVVAMLDQFEQANMLFRWTDAQGKAWAYWVDIDKPGRLPPPSERNREKRGPEPPADQLAAFVGASYPAPTQVLGASDTTSTSPDEAGSLRMRTGTGTRTGTGNGLRTGTRMEPGEEGKTQAASKSSGSSSSSSQTSISFAGAMQETPPVPEPEATPALSKVEPEIRGWTEDRFGVSGTRLRNCILYQLDHAKNGWYREHAITAASMEREKFVRKIDADTPQGWTPEKAKAANKPVSSKEAQTAQKTEELLAKFGATVNE